MVLAVDDLDPEVRRGEVFGLLGPNDAGKTTTLEIIEGLAPADAGKVEVLGLDLREHGPEIRSRFGVQLQSTSLYNKITPREALDLYGSYYPRRRPTVELLELVQLVDKADAYHATLSGGQQQRLAVALALVNEPELVFLDEPTSFRTCSSGCRCPGSWRYGIRCRRTTRHRGGMPPRSARGSRARPARI